MTTYQTAGASLVLLALVCFLPSTVQLIKRRLREHADAELVTELQRVTAQRDRYHGLYNEAVKRNALLLQGFGGDGPPRALSADERAWDQEVSS